MLKVNGRTRRRPLAMILAASLCAVANLGALSTAQAQGGQLSDAEQEAAAKAALDKIYKDYYDRHPAWQRVVAIDKSLSAAYERMRAANPGQPTFEVALEAAFEGRSDDIVAHRDEAVAAMNRTRAMDHLLKNAEWMNTATIDDPSQMTRAERERLIGAYLATSPLIMSAVHEISRALLNSYADGIDRLMVVHPFDAQTAQAIRRDLQSVRDLGDYHIDISRRDNARITDKILDEAAPKITDVLEEAGAFRSPSDTSDLTFRTDDGAYIVYYSSGDIGYHDPSERDAAGDRVFHQISPRAGAGQMSDAELARLEAFVRRTFGDRAPAVLGGLRIHRGRLSRQGKTASMTEWMAAIDEARALMAGGVTDVDDPDWGRLKDLIDTYGLPELQLRPDLMRELMAGSATLTVAELAPIYAGVDLERGARIERIIPSLWERATSNVATIPSFQAFGPSQVMVTPNLWANTPSSAGSTPIDAYARGPSQVMTTPNVWANTPSSAGTSPNVWGATGLSSAFDRTQDARLDRMMSPNQGRGPAPAAGQLCGR